MSTPPTSPPKKLPATLAPSPIDLTDLATVKSWLSIQPNNTDADVTLQFLITSFSQYVLNKTGRDSFSSINTYLETYDGNGSARLFLRNSPIVSVASVSAGSYTFPISTDSNTFGVYIDSTKKSIILRGRILSNRVFHRSVGFPIGYGNISVNYSAGYASVPFDLQEATMRAVSQNYQRKDWIDLASKTLSAGGGASGTTRYRDWALEPMVERVLDFYSRYAMP